MESEFEVLGIARKLVKYMVYLSKRKNWKKMLFFHRVPKQQMTNFWSQGILGAKEFVRLLALQFIWCSLPW
jgi:hypothetical protein